MRRLLLDAPVATDTARWSTDGLPLGGPPPFPPRDWDWHAGNVRASYLPQQARASLAALDVRRPDYQPQSPRSSLDALTVRASLAAITVRT